MRATAAAHDLDASAEMPHVASVPNAPSLRSVTRTRRASTTDETTANTVTPMNPLARLILRRKNELGMTWQELAKAGEFSSHTVLYALAHKPEHRQVPRPETLKRLAKAIDVPLDVVKATAAEAAGYSLQEVGVTLDSAEDVRFVAQVMGEISVADRAKLRRLAMAFRDEARQARGQQGHGG